MTAIATGPSELSYLSDQDLEPVLRRRSNIAMATIFVVVVGVISSALICTSKADREIDQQYTAKLGLYTQAARSVETARQTKLQQQRIGRDADLAASLLEKVPRSVILANLTDAMPAGVSLLDFSVEQPSSAAQSASVRLTAVAGSDIQVTQFIQKLNQSKLLRDVNLVISDSGSQDAGATLQFQLEASVDPTVK